MKILDIEVFSDKLQILAKFISKRYWENQRKIDRLRSLRGKK